MSTPEEPGSCPELLINKLGWWLDEDLISSNCERGTPYGDLGARRDDLRGPFIISSNMIARDVMDQYTQLERWSIKGNPDDYQADSWLTARLILASLKAVRTSYRTQCYLQSGSQTDFAIRYQSKPTSINLERVITDAVGASEDDTSRFGDKGFGKLVEKTRELNKRNIGLYRLVHDLTEEKQSPKSPLVQSETSLPVMVMEDLQKLWTELAVRTVVTASSLRDGGLPNVPFPDPSNTRQLTGKVIYPLLAD